MTIAPKSPKVVVAGKLASSAGSSAMPRAFMSAAVASGQALPDAATRVFTALHFTYGRVIEEQDSTGAARMEPAAAQALAARFLTIAQALTEAVAQGLTARHAFDAGIRLIL